MCLLCTFQLAYKLHGKQHYGQWNWDAISALSKDRKLYFIKLLHTMCFSPARGSRDRELPVTWLVNSDKSQKDEDYRKSIIVSLFYLPICTDHSSYENSRYNSFLLSCLLRHWILMVVWVCLSCSLWKRRLPGISIDMFWEHQLELTMIPEKHGMDFYVSHRWEFKTFLYYFSSIAWI